MIMKISITFPDSLFKTSLLIHEGVIQDSVVAYSSPVTQKCLSSYSGMSSSVILLFSRKLSQVLIEISLNRAVVKLSVFP